MRAAFTVLLFSILLHGIALHAQPAAPGAPSGTPTQRQLLQQDSVTRAAEGRALAGRVIEAVGGLAAWNDPSWDLSFDFVTLNKGTEAGRYSHVWYRSLNRYIVTGKNKEGKVWRVRFSDLGRKEGWGTLDGNDVPDSLKARFLEMAYGRYINDTYWMLMPFKLLDSGVHHRREPDTVIDGTTYSVLQLSFGNVGLTPGDRYWLFIDPATNLVQRWRYHLQSDREGEFLWTDYNRYGPLLIPTRRRSIDGTFEIRFENIRVDVDGKDRDARRTEQ